MEHRTEARFPGGYKTTIAVESPGSGEVWEFHTDYSKPYGGEGSAPTPWDTFLAAMTACQGIHVRNFIAENGIPTDEVRVQMDLVVADDGREVKEFRTNIVLPKDFPEELKEKTIAEARHCKVVQHLLDWNPVVKYSIEIKE